MLTSTCTYWQERCAGADTVSLVARILYRSKAHLQLMLLQINGAVVEDFYAQLVRFSFMNRMIWEYV